VTYGATQANSQKTETGKSGKREAVCSNMGYSKIGWKIQGSSQKKAMENEKNKSIGGVDQ
jgi:hypothetical protein